MIVVMLASTRADTVIVPLEPQPILNTSAQAKIADAEQHTSAADFSFRLLFIATVDVRSPMRNRLPSCHNYSISGFHTQLWLFIPFRRGTSVAEDTKEDKGRWLECWKAGGRWDLYKGPDLSNIRIKGDGWIRRRSVLKGRPGVLYIPPVLTVIQGSKATFNHRVLGCIDGNGTSTSGYRASEGTDKSSREGLKVCVHEFTHAHIVAFGRGFVSIRSPIIVTLQVPCFGMLCQYMARVQLTAVARRMKSLHNSHVPPHSDDHLFPTSQT
ncbi:hypothetical protein EV421DRAFT_1746550 [Armillaria borealis]|uniref:Uncharacterized protein n=1 Tax=Armillaria borealis TaxID=47425 RepID=A0AA39IED8_9AGAR|nr:hypothetical protein EV421DRAFT_1746550 [Armillaria borealis]